MRKLFILVFLFFFINLPLKSTSFRNEVLAREDTVFTQQKIDVSTAGQGVGNHPEEGANNFFQVSSEEISPAESGEGQIAGGISSETGAVKGEKTQTVSLKWLILSVPMVAILLIVFYQKKIRGKNV